MNQIAPIHVPACGREPAVRHAAGRRGFLTAGAAFGGGLLLGLSLPPSARAAAAGVQTATVNVFVVIGTDNSVTLITPGGEMGQGINAGLAQVFAEELPLDWTTLKTVPAPFGAQYGRGSTHSQVTGGSFNMRGWFPLMLQAGATAREMLLAAARAGFPNAVLPLTAVAGTVKDAHGTLVATYGQLATAASAITLPGPAALRSSPGSYSVIGQRLQRPDVRLKVDGSAVFGIDVRLPGMVYASVHHCPTLGGTVGSMGGGSNLINLGNAVAATGANTWAAVQAARGARVTWNLPGAPALAQVDTTAIAAAAKTLMTSGTPAIAESAGDVTGAMAAAVQTIDVTYALPYLAHACMEVLNCTVSLTKDATGRVTGCQMWAPTQAPDRCAATVATLTGLPLSAITVTTTYMGGGLGRKIEQDYIAQAVKVAQAVGKPVKLVWPREEDFARDWCRPAALSRVQIGLDRGGNITAWHNRIVAQSLSRSHGTAPKNGIDSIPIGGAVGVPYAFGARLVEYVEQIAGIQIGYWRSVGESISCFVVESAIDECAKAVGVDPYQYRRRLLAGNAPVLAVLDAAATLGKWGTPPVKGHARGIALSPGFGSMCAVVAELALGASGQVQIVALSVAIDCGTAVNPDQVVRQIEGGVLHGLNAAMWQQMTYANGVTPVRNFGDYPMGRMANCPPVAVTIVNQGSALGGIGEAGVPGVAPAIANAHAALTGIRKRSLPLNIAPAPRGDG